MASRFLAAARAFKKGPRNARVGPDVILGGSGIAPLR